MLVVVFQDENNAFEGEKALLQLDTEGRITVYAYAVVAKDAYGTTLLKRHEDFGPVGVLAGSSLTSLIGLLGGRWDLEIGAPVRLTTHITGSGSNVRIGADFIEEVKEAFLPWRFALVAEVAEGWTTPVDSLMEAIGGVVLRRALSRVEDRVDVEHVTALRADMAQLKAEQVKAHADRKVKLQEKINRIESKLRAQFEEAKERRHAAKREAQAKLYVLRAKAISDQTAEESDGPLSGDRA